MLSVILYPNLKKKVAVDLAHTLYDQVKLRNIGVFAPEEASQALGVPSVCQEMGTVLAVVAIGGDGTILRMFHEYPAWDYPVLGVNLGGLGFMTDISVAGLSEALDDFLQGKYQIQKRMMMKISCEHGTFHAVNDVCIHRGRLPCLIETHVHVDGNFVSTFNADGLIVSTPNGSTAYSLSAGGPIVWPQMECLVLTPICPHTLSNRPIVIPARHPVHIEYISETAGADLSVDGFNVGTMAPGQALVIECSERNFRWIELANHDYYQTLRGKLGWNAHPRNHPSR
jgi:NAD+ kinase